jgi:L,D-transpeptidase catalytic domain
MRGPAVILTAALVWLISIASAEAKLDILVDKASQRMLVIQDGYVRYMWPVSTGRDNMQTPNGVYTPQRLERNWSSSAYYDSPMPHAIFFHNGYAIHGSYAIDRLGGPASHGCVRLHPHHAAVLFDLVQMEGPDNTTIEVTDDGRRFEGAPLPGGEIAAGPYVGPPLPRSVNDRDGGDMPDLSPPRRGNRLLDMKNASPPRPAPVTEDGRLEPPALPRREIAGGGGVNPQVPRKLHYRERSDMPDLPPLQHGNRLMGARLPPRSAVPPSGRMLADVRPPANATRYGAGQADRANGAPRPSSASSDYRPRSRFAEGAPPELEQQAPSNRGFKVLPASCWSGGASRWHWWSSREETACK